MQTISTLPYLTYLAEAILARIDHYFGAKTAIGGFPAQPKQNGVPSPIANFVEEHNLNSDELLLLLIGLAPHIQPTFYESIILERIPKSGDFPDFGGVRGKQFRGILPTGDTALFILAGGDERRRLKVQELFSADHIFYRKRILWLEKPPQGEPRMCGKIILSQEYVELFTTGKSSRPHFSADFPAQLVKTQLEWEDLVIPGDIKQQIVDLQKWVLHNQGLIEKWKLSKWIRPGYRVLFHGPPGTGKTLTASLIGKYTHKDVYRIDLSTVVSKYIGETEKNLSSLFDVAEDKNWILFFDEADSLFGKRTNVRDAHDKYANQEVSYLLQRIEDFSGMVILSSNFKSNIDEAFMRRFNAAIKFPMPARPEREEIWKKALPEDIPYEKDKSGKPLDIPRLASKYELSGGHIVNAIHYACLRLFADQVVSIRWEYLLDAISREFEKEGRVFTR